MEDDECPELVFSDELEGAELDKKDKAVSSRVPITLLAGFLGSGKTSLLKDILVNGKGRKIAVLMNEVGETGELERSLMSDLGGEELYDEWINLANGCMCCTVKDNGVLALEKILSQKGRFDNIVIEASGVADPGALTKSFWIDEALGASVCLDGVVTVVDATNLDAVLRDEQSLGVAQIAQADYVVLNKVDLVTHERLERCRQVLRGINAVAIVEETTFGHVHDVGKLLDLQAYESESSLTNLSSWTSTLVSNKSCHHHQDESTEHDCEEKLHEHHHGHGQITTRTIPLPSSMSLDQLDKWEDWIRSILWRPLDDDYDETAKDAVLVYRSKAIFRMDDQTCRVLQGVRDVYEIVQPSVTPTDEFTLLQPNLVFIGKNVEFLSVPEELLRSS
ncbi:CobW/HypB/UreG nucleotide binding domain-containing protein [Schizosaccharomyces japonicus yFS275]|uniref:CobW/HypB/UreG nucleotide binding domain-containing protein n=1 Tax=Schizosaccharomyces japonicus (strain yFS275 / FY16936) TaxID=402676 RepID=B6JWZ8_SCHJY|nr:CobW/HypB/UreG nucleotide binding domain-containing protein [Schizosaccharomyces japonicus yFS275]EEB05899.1 CobW/HypB/UreG nucleotide binding domain-containing protein [Schizosaccharomyces japonicus yFS275]